MNLISASTISPSSFAVGIPFQAREILSKQKTPFFSQCLTLHNTCTGSQQVLCGCGSSESCSDSVTNEISSGNPSNSNPATYIPNPSLSPQLSDHLMGKSPLRLVAQRRRANAGEYYYWIETLECGHVQEAHRSDLSDSETEPTAKRRRCQKCKGEQPLLYRPYTPLPLKKDCLTLRVVDYLNWAQDNEERVQLRDDIAIARLAVILAGQGDPEPWRWAFIKLLGGTPEKLIPIFVARMEAHRKMEDPPKKPSTSETLQGYPARRKYSQLGFNPKSEESA